MVEYVLYIYKIKYKIIDQWKLCCFKTYIQTYIKIIVRKNHIKLMIISTWCHEGTFTSNRIP